MNAFLAELRRRNVFRVAVAYLVVGWLILQVITVIAEPLGLPVWTDTLVIVLLGIAFPIALILAWAFEVTPEGVKLTTAVDAETSISSKTGQKLDYAIGAGIVLLIAAIIWQQSTRPDTAQIGEVLPVSVEAGANTIAVLPFADLSIEGNQTYFADGISEEILNVLAQIDELEVTSRTSAFMFRSDSNLSIPDIAAALGVRHVLEGSIRTAGSTIRITAQLIDASTDQHLWSDTFDRELNAENLFAVQDDIAAAISLALADRMGVEIAAPRAERATSDVDAYGAYLRGRELFLNRNYTNLPIAIEALEQAVELDPDFAQAWALLGAAYGVSPGWAFSDRDYYALALNAGNQALELQPNNAMGYTAIAQAAATAQSRDWGGVLANYNRALEIDPDNPTTRLWRGQILRDLGFFEQALEDFDACVAAQPLYGVCLYNRAGTLLLTASPDEALNALVPAMGTGHVESYPDFLGLLARHDDPLLLAFMIRETADTIPLDVRWIVPEMQRALSDEVYDREAALEQFRRRLADSGWDPDRDAYIATTYFLAFRAYDRIPIDGSNGWFWLPGYRGLAGSEAARAMLHRRGIVDYWYEAGFPPHCRPDGEGDFECDWPDGTRG
jgi:TolB-like protein/Flp pilus assembly protein TadD